MELALKVGDKELIKFCKNKVKEMNKRSLESGKDFQEHEVSHTFSKEELDNIEKVLSSVLEFGDIASILKAIGISPHFRPRLKTVEEQSKNVPVGYQIVNLETVSADGHIVRGGSDPTRSWFMKMYSINQQIIITTYLRRIFYKLMKDEKNKTPLTWEGLSEYFTNSKLFEEENLKVVLVGLKRYFEEDYVSAIHILIPQFESFFLKIAEKTGIDIVALDQKLDLATRTKTLSDRYLDSDEFKNIFGEDFCMQLRFILFEPLGYKLRHKVAHGEIRAEECNFETATLILHLYLIVLGHASVEQK